MQQIGRYQIIGELGRGAMGVVYRAQDPAIGRTVAIKTIRLSDFTEASERDRLRERLIREAQSAGILSHPGIVTIYDIAQEADMAYIFMEFVDGPPLEKLLQSETTPGRDEILTIFQQTAAALDYAHKKGIVHRDIKPANIMIADDGSAKITDFGVAKIVSQQMTQAGAMMGTPSYMSPEQVQGAPVDGRADQFALSVIAFELLTGEKPFVADYLPTLLYKIVREDPVAPQRLNPTLSPKVETVLRKGLAKNPGDRYATCAEFVTALAVACRAKPDWKPMPRGAAQTQETVASTGPTAPGSSPLPGAAAAAAPAGPAATPAAPAPAHRRPRLDDETGDGSRKKLVLIGVGVLALVGVIFGVRMISPKEGSGANTQAKAQAQVETPRPNLAKAGSPAAASSEGTPSAAKPPVPAPTPAPTRPSPMASQGQTQTPVRPTQPSGAPRGGAETGVQISSTPPGAQVVVNGDAGMACTTPCTVNLKPGRHTLIATLDGYRRFAKIFNLPQEPALNLALDRMMGKLSVRTTPAGATIYVDGQMRPERSPAFLSLPAGRYKVAVVKEGLPRQEEDVVVRDGGISDLEWNWGQR